MLAPVVAPLVAAALPKAVNVGMNLLSKWSGKRNVPTNKRFPGVSGGGEAAADGSAKWQKGPLLQESPDTQRPHSD